MLEAPDLEILSIHITASIAYASQTSYHKEKKKFGLGKEPYLQRDRLSLPAILLYHNGVHNLVVLLVQAISFFIPIYWKHSSVFNPSTVLKLLCIELEL